MSVALLALAAAAFVLAAGYRFGRTHAAWKEVRNAKDGVRHNRRHAWHHTGSAAVNTILLIAIAALTTLIALR